MGKCYGHVILGWDLGEIRVRIEEEIISMMKKLGINKPFGKNFIDSEIRDFLFIGCWDFYGYWHRYLVAINVPSATSERRHTFGFSEMELRKCFAQSFDGSIDSEEIAHFMNAWRQDRPFFFALAGVVGMLVKKHEDEDPDKLEKKHRKLEPKLLTGEDEQEQEKEEEEEANRSQ
mgnify:CR=1 FL=1